MIATQNILSNEREIFTRIATGDQQAFALIFNHYSQRLYNFIFSKAKSDELTEEVLQEVFIKIWEKRTEMKDVQNFEAYIFTMATNKTYDFLRKMATNERLKQKVWESMQVYSNITAEAIDLKYCEQMINEAVEKLSPQRKKVFVLSRKEGLNRHEIAAQLNISANTVDNQLREALMFIKNYLHNTSDVSMLLFLVLLKLD